MRLPAPVVNSNKQLGAHRMGTRKLADHLCFALIHPGRSVWAQRRRRAHRTCPTVSSSPSAAIRAAGSAILPSCPADELEGDARASTDARRDHPAPREFLSNLLALSSFPLQAVLTSGSAAVVPGMTAHLSARSPRAIRFSLLGSRTSVRACASQVEASCSTMPARSRANAVPLATCHPRKFEM